VISPAVTPSVNAFAAAPADAGTESAANATTIAATFPLTGPTLSRTPPPIQDAEKSSRGRYSFKLRPVRNHQVMSRAAHRTAAMGTWERLARRDARTAVGRQKPGSVCPSPRQSRVIPGNPRGKPRAAHSGRYRLLMRFVTSLGRRFTRERSPVRNQPRPSSRDGRRGWILHTTRLRARSKPAAPMAPIVCVGPCPSKPGASGMTRVRALA
jgi:hypothetical protein